MKANPFSEARSPNRRWTIHGFIATALTLVSTCVLLLIMLYNYL